MYDLRLSSLQLKNSVLILLLLSFVLITETAAQSDVLREGFVFYLKDYKMEHHEETHLLNITVRYDFVRGINEKDYPDFVPLVKFVEKFLTDYPNENSYWEIINKQLTQRLLAENPGLATVTCELEVPPSQRFKFTRSSIVTRERHAKRPSRK